jgi:hypothetical protein
LRQITSTPTSFSSPWTEKQQQAKSKTTVPFLSASAPYNPTPHTAGPKALYTYTVPGHRDPGREHAHPQILLVTNTIKTHYRPVDYDTTPLYLAPGWTTSSSSTASHHHPPSKQQQQQ